jgi:hypothetical protein
MADFVVDVFLELPKDICDVKLLLNKTTELF